MNSIPKKLRHQLGNDPYYHRCARAGIGEHVCAGRITWEHALTYAGRQVQARYAILPLCAKAHDCDEWQDRGDMCKEINVWLCLNRAIQEELLELSHKGGRDYFLYKSFLNKRYGIPSPAPLPDDAIAY